MNLFNRVMDRQMYYYVNEYCKLQHVTVEELMQAFDQNKESEYAFWTGINKKLHSNNQITFLKLRFTYLHNNKSFNSKDCRLLEKLFRKMKSSGKIDWDCLLYHFPGKTHQLIMEKLESGVLIFSA